MSTRVPVIVATLGLVLLGAALAIAQEAVRIEPPPSAGLGGIGGAGGVVTSPGQLTTSPMLSAPSPAPSIEAPNVNASPSAAAPAPSPANGENDNQDAPQANSPLLAAHSSANGNSGECDITDAAHQTCSGEDCLLSCPSDVCPGQESDKCEFVIDCLAEITADATSDDQQCDEQFVEHSTFERDGTTMPVTVIRIPAGQQCKPPPCVK
ncbi:hypothetical protein [Hyphomicrobium sp.]|uniref:hypothetical protein n=1 Tax=Hyphomicrobium sp. TaxID=82 RepID=UPI000F9DE313|nr:hypothetical protein [Hyphomicrobium sp.]RUP10465.1 MAG: hypothetical protein EKK38_02725 [Hyphomicrobium sp.]